MHAEQDQTSNRICHNDASRYGVGGGDMHLSFLLLGS